MRDGPVCSLPNGGNEPDHRSPRPISALARRSASDRRARDRGRPRPPRAGAEIKGRTVFELPWNTTSHSVTVGPDGVPWFGTDALATRPRLSARRHAAGRRARSESRDWSRRQRSRRRPDPLQFDAQGQSLVRPVATSRAGARPARSRRHRNRLRPARRPKPWTRSRSAPEGNVWFARGYRQIGRDDSGRRGDHGSRSPPKSYPALDRHRPRRSPLVRRGTAPGRSVGSPRTVRSSSSRSAAASIRASSSPAPTAPSGSARTPDAGRVRNRSTASAGSPPAARSPSSRSRFGGGTYAARRRPSGAIWFTTAKDEISSISTTGNVGRRGCSAGAHPLQRASPSRPKARSGSRSTRTTSARMWRRHRPDPAARGRDRRRDPAGALAPPSGLPERRHASQPSILLILAAALAMVPAPAKRPAPAIEGASMCDPRAGAVESQFGAAKPDRPPRPGDPYGRSPRRIKPRRTEVKPSALQRPTAPTFTYRRAAHPRRPLRRLSRPGRLQGLRTRSDPGPTAPGRGHHRLTRTSS